MGSIATQHVLITVPFPESPGAMDEIRRRHPSFKVTYIHLTDPDVLSGKHNISDATWGDVTILVTLAALPRDPALAPKLKLVQFIGSGINHVINHPIWTSTAIPLANSSGVAAPAIAEWIVMAILASGRALPTFQAWQRARSWGPPDGDGGKFIRFVGGLRDSVGQRVGILGYGAIGRQTARLLGALGMDVRVHTASPRPTPASRADRAFHVAGLGDPAGAAPRAWSAGTDRDSVRAFLAQDLDVLVLAAPLTPATRGLLGAPELALLARRNALLVNVARGPLVDSDALVGALCAYAAGPRADGTRAGLRGAALDVADPEPLPREHALWAAPNTIITPHVSSQTAGYMDRIMQLLEVNLDRFERGEQFVNLLDRKKGYSSFD